MGIRLLRKLDVLINFFLLGFWLNVYERNCFLKSEPHVFQVWRRSIILLRFKNLTGSILRKLLSSQCNELFRWLSAVAIWGNPSSVSLCFEFQKVHVRSTRYACYSKWHGKRWRLEAKNNNLLAYLSTNGVDCLWDKKTKQNTSVKDSTRGGGCGQLCYQIGRKLTFKDLSWKNERAIVHCVGSGPTSFIFNF